MNTFTKSCITEDKQRKENVCRFLDWTDGRGSSSEDLGREARTRRRRSRSVTSSREERQQPVKVKSGGDEPSVSERTERISIDFTFNSTPLNHRFPVFFLKKYISCIRPSFCLLTVQYR